MNKINCFLFLIILFTMNGMSKKTEDIVFSEGNTLFFCDYNGNFKNKIEFPYELKDFKLKGSHICFVDDSERIRLLNIDNMKEEKIPEGPYLYKDKIRINKNVEMINGHEKYRDVDFSIEKKWIVCVVRPEYYKREYNDGEEKDSYYNPKTEDYDESSNVVLIDYGNGKINIDIAHDEEGYYGHCLNPCIFQDLIFFNSGDDSYFFDFNKKKKDHLNKIFSDYFKLKDEGDPIYYLSLKKDKLIFRRIVLIIESNKVKIAYEEIYSYDFVKKSFKKIKELKNYRKIGDPYNRILDISSNYGHILVNDGNDMYLVDLKNLKKKLIHKFEKVLYKAQFYCK